MQSLRQLGCENLDDEGARRLPHAHRPMLSRGMTNREIALHLLIRIKTVDTHRSHF